MNTLKVKTEKGQSFTLDQSNHIHSGGEGSVHKIGSKAIKVYHDISSMIPIDKIKELQKIQDPRVLYPLEIVYRESTNKPCGFIMTHISNPVYLSWVFNKGYKNKNSIDSEAIKNLILKAKSLFTNIHTANCIIGDPNEMNFLLDTKHTDIYSIDVDSFQTPSFRCTAIMESVQDPTVKFGYVSRETDWFGFAVITFQLWTGIHPFQGIHPNYSRGDALNFTMMKNGISVFNKECRLPKNAISPDVIPKNLKVWYEGVFEKKDRSIPPNPSNVMVVQQIQKILSTDKITITELKDYNSNIQQIISLNGQLYILTKDECFNNDMKIEQLSRNINYNILKIEGSMEVSLINTSSLSFKVKDKTHEIKASHSFVLNGVLYTVKTGKLIKHSLKKQFNTIVHSEEVIDTVFENSAHIYDGLVVSNAFGVNYITIPHFNFSCSTIQLPTTMNKRRIVDGKYFFGGTLEATMLISEEKGKYYKSIIWLENRKLANITEILCPSSEQANFTINNKGIMVYVNKDDEMMLTNGKNSILIEDPPIENSNELYTDGVNILFTLGKKLYQVRTK